MSVTGEEAEPPDEKVYRQLRKPSEDLPENGDPFDLGGYKSGWLYKS
jgi:hypothetical protein